MDSFKGEIINIIYGWAFLLFLGAADCESCSSVSEKADDGGDCSCDDPPRMGNVQSVQVNPRHSSYFVFRRDDLHPLRCYHLQQSEESVGYVDTG